MHVAIIMDGNGRWASRRGQPRVAGHREGAKSVRRVVEAAPHFGIRYLTLYAFSSDNWKRPASEVNTLLSLFRDYLRSEAESCAREGVKLSVIGRRDRLPALLREAIEQAEGLTRSADRLHLRIAVDYSARDAILRAGGDAGVERGRDDFRKLLGGIPDVDLLIRTGGEQRLSDFLLWESAYAELYFTETMWPEFAAEDLERAMRDFHTRQRRFGGLVVDPEPARI
jgi:undecaprenyl diphosphate synthase